MGMNLMKQKIIASNLDPHLSSHIVNIDAILQSIHLQNNPDIASLNTSLPSYLKLPGIKDYQKFIYKHFSHIINIPSFDYISKTDKGWLIVGDNRNLIASSIKQVIAERGIGVGMMVLHAQQMNTQHILLELTLDGKKHDLTSKTVALTGVREEKILSIPLRKYRDNWKVLSQLSIVKDTKAIDKSKLVTHEGGETICFYCSSREMNPAEVVVDINKDNYGLARNYNLGFTFAPFGNPLSAMHFLAWDHSKNPLNMSRTPMTASDLIELTVLINKSIVDYFIGTKITDFPTLDGLSNGWAGNSIFHQHFQFFQLEFDYPINKDYLSINPPILSFDNGQISKLSWPTPIYKITATDPENSGLLGNDMTNIWRLLAANKKELYKSFREGYIPTNKDKVPIHTQNILVIGKDFGRTVFIIPRDRKKIEYPNGKKLGTINVNGSKQATYPKKNIATLEAAGIMINDDDSVFAKMATWSPQNITDQIAFMLKAISPRSKSISDLEVYLRGLYPN